jgi:malonyl CoA-acyl carrier protein transacylase
VGCRFESCWDRQHLTRPDTRPDANFSEPELTHEPDHEIEYELARYSQSGRKRSKAIVAVPALAVVGIAAAFLWAAYGRDLPVLSFIKSRTSAMVGSVEPAEMKDFQIFQRQISEQMQTATQLLQSQQAELKLLSDQTAALTAKIDALTQSAPTAQPAIPLSAPATVQTEKRKPVRKPTSGISVGGAPLPVGPKSEGR